MALAVAALLVPGLARAQMQPHHAEYSLRLGTALNAPRIGTAVQDIALDCTGWRIRRVGVMAGWLVRQPSLLKMMEPQCAARASSL